MLMSNTEKLENPEKNPNWGLVRNKCHYGLSIKSQTSQRD